MARTCKHRHTHTHTRTRMWVCVYACMYACMHACIYMYVIASLNTRREWATKQGLLHFVARHKVHVRLFWDKVSDFLPQVPSKAPALWEQYCVLELSDLPACLADAVMWSAA